MFVPPGTILKLNLIFLASWCSGYDYCTTSFNKVLIQVLHRFKSWSRRVGDLVRISDNENKAKRLLPVNNSTKQCQCTRLRRYNIT